MMTSPGASHAATQELEVEGRPAFRWATHAPALIVFFGGANLILMQWVLVRELTALLQGTELVVLLVSVAYFLGLSVGYKVVGRVRRSWLVPLGVATLIVHLSLPIWFRLLVTGLASLKLYWLAYLVLPCLAPFVVSAFYSVFLPLFVDNAEGTLPGLYALELLGSAFGVMALVILSRFGLQTIYAVYSAGLLAILVALGARFRWLAWPILASAVWVLVLPEINYWSNNLWYEGVQGLSPGTRTLYSAYSAYQKIDVLEAPDGTRYLFLDGLEHFGSADGTRLNVVMGQIPASIIQPQNALVFGAGTMEMARFIADYSEQVTTVEIDPLVVEASQRYFARYNHLDILTNRTIVIDDAKYFIANTDQQYDLIATDLPAAYAIQTATLYSAPFYRSVGDHLKPHGVLVANLTATFEPRNLIARRVAASLLATFDQVIVVTAPSAGWSFAYAGKELPFNLATLQAALHERGETQFIIYDTPAVRLIVDDAKPITLDSMDLVLQTSLQWIKARMKGS